MGAVASFGSRPPTNRHVNTLIVQKQGALAGRRRPLPVKDEPNRVARETTTRRMGGCLLAEISQLIPRQPAPRRWSASQNGSPGRAVSCMRHPG